MNESAPDLDLDKTRAIIEALLLTCEEPISPGKLVDLLDGVNGRDIRQAIDALNEQYQRGNHGIAVVELAGGFQLATRPEMAPWLRKFHRDQTPVRLSQAAMETLAIIAFKEPITRVEVDSIRGVNSAGVVQTLMELNMVRLVGRSSGIGKPMLFGTTREFLIHFGLTSLADLPKPRELEELLAEGEQKARSRGQQSLELPQVMGEAPAASATGATAAEEAGAAGADDLSPVGPEAAEDADDGS